MKKLLCFITLVIAMPWITLGQDFTIIESDGHHVSLRFELNEFAIDTVSCGGELMHTITTKGITVPNEYGEPNLPTFNRFIAIPQGATATIEVRPSRSERISGINIAPSMGSQCEHEAERPFHKEPKLYGSDALYPTEAVVMAKPQRLRGVDVVHLGISPVQFNPARREITVNRQFDIEIRFEGGNGQFGDDRLRSPYWDPILKNVILNHNALQPIDYHARRQQWLESRPTGCEYLILTPDNEAFIDAAQELANYRTRQGIITKVMNIAETGATTPGTLRFWIRNIYQTWDIPPTAVCLLGDQGDNMQQYIPAFRTQHPKDGFISSDNPYADIDDDALPDICFSRLVAQNAEELPVFISKVMEYEYTNPCMNPYYYQHPLTASAWQTTLWFQITSSTVYGYLSQHGKTPTRLSEIYGGELSDQWSSANGTSTVVNYFGPSGVGYIPASPSELGGWTGGNADHVIRAFNQGAYLVQHRDHGWTTKWYQPEIYTSDFGNINNIGKMPFLISVNCKTGQFDHTSNCFTEALLRMTRDGQNAGIVGAIAPSGQTYSFANDIFLWGIWDHFDPNFLPDYGSSTDHISEWMPAFAMIAGKYYLEAETFPNTNPTMRATTYNTFHAHCDPFLRMYTDMPQTIEATFDPTFTIYSPFHFTVPEGIEVALSTYYGGQTHLLATATGTGQEQTFVVNSYIPTGRVKLTMTGQNHLRREETIVVSAINGPFVVTDSIAINQGALQLPYGASATIDLNVKNIGTQASNAGNAQLSTTSEHMQVTQAQTSFTALAPNEAQLIGDAFHITLSDDLPDWAEVPFSITTQFNGQSLNRDFNLKVMAPHFATELVGVSDPLGNGNGRLDPGEFATLTFSTKNIGHLVAENVTFTLSNDEGYIRCITPEVTLHDVGIYHENDISFDIFVEFIAGESTSMHIDLINRTRNLVETNSYNLSIGFTIEDFESHELDPVNWTNDPDHPWVFVTNLPYQGTYCLKSGLIDHSQKSEINLTYTSNADGKIAFYRKVSTEVNYDFLYFRIDGTTKERWSGDLPQWYYCEYPVRAGTHQYTWSYEKDHSVSNNDDCAYIDYIALPPFLDQTAEQPEIPLTIHPNPATDVVRIDIEREGDYVVNVYDGKGKLLMSKRNQNTLSFNGMAAGMYHIEVVQNGQRWSRKMIKM